MAEVRKLELHPESNLKTSDADRYASILNIINGYEEYVLDSTGTIVGSNLEAVTITGYEEWEIIGRHVSIFYSSEDQLKGIPESDLRQAANRSPYYTSGLRMKKRSSPFWAKVKIIAQRGDDGLIAGYRVTLRDSTHKAVYSHNLNLVRDEYQNLFNNSFIGIVKFHLADFQILLLNEKGYEILGPNAINAPLHSCFKDQQKFRSFIKTLIDKERAEDWEFELTTAEGRSVWVLMSCKYFKSAGFAEGILADITQRKLEYERSLELSNELENFIYHASHDLRSPITTLFGLVNLLRRDDAPEKVKHYSKLIEERLHHLDGILRDLVKIAFNTTAPIAHEPIDLVAEVNEFIKEYHHQFEHVLASVTHTGHEAFVSDKVRVRSILKNLISNAFKYHNPNAPKCFVSIDIVLRPEQVEITIADNGIGISQDYIDRVFRLFYKANERYIGNGLGLYTVKSMVDKLSGSIKVDSTLGTGTIFQLVLPNNTCVT